MSDILKQVTDYEIISSESSEILEKNVKKFMSKGWEPLGGVSVAVDQHQDLYFAQAMVKQETKIVICNKCC